jgi:iron complex outermembrane receptor protein
MIRVMCFRESTSRSRTTTAFAITSTASACSLRPSISWQLNPDTSLLVESEIVRHSSTFDRGIVAPNNKWSGVSRSTFLGEPNDGNIDNHNNLLQATLEHHLNDSWKLRLASHYKEGKLWGDASENPVR